MHTLDTLLLYNSLSFRRFHRWFINKKNEKTNRLCCPFVLYIGWNMELKMSCRSPAIPYTIAWIRWIDALAIVALPFVCVALWRLYDRSSVIIHSMWGMSWTIVWSLCIEAPTCVRSLWILVSTLIRSLCVEPLAFGRSLRVVTLALAGSWCSNASTLIRLWWKSCLLWLYCNKTATIVRSGAIVISILIYTLLSGSLALIRSLFTCIVVLISDCAPLRVTPTLIRLLFTKAETLIWSLFTIAPTAIRSLCRRTSTRRCCLSRWTPILCYLWSRIPISCGY